MQISNLGLSDAQYLLATNGQSLFSGGNSTSKNQQKSSESFGDTVSLSSAGYTKPATITLNIHDMSNAQLLETEQTLGEQSAVSSLETDSTSTVSQIAGQTQAIDQFAQLGNASLWQAENGSPQGASEFLSLQQLLASQADSAGNITLNAAKFYSFAAQDATNTYQ